MKIFSQDSWCPGWYSKLRSSWTWVKSVTTMPTHKWHCVTWQIGTNVSEELAASVFKVPWLHNVTFQKTVILVHLEVHLWSSADHSLTHNDSIRNSITILPKFPMAPIWPVTLCMHSAVFQQKYESIYVTLLVIMVSILIWKKKTSSTGLKPSHPVMQRTCISQIKSLFFILHLIPGNKQCTEDLQ